MEWATLAKVWDGFTSIFIRQAVVQGLANLAWGNALFVFALVGWGMARFCCKKSDESKNCDKEQAEALFVWGVLFYIAMAVLSIVALHFFIRTGCQLANPTYYAIERFRDLLP